MPKRRFETSLSFYLCFFLFCSYITVCFSSLVFLFLDLLMYAFFGVVWMGEEITWEICPLYKIELWAPFAILFSLFLIDPFLY